MTEPFRKTVLIVIDGLRPDAITPGGMPILHEIFARGWRAGRALTVRPSVTVAALTSLASGVGPTRHGMTEARLLHLPRLRHLRPLPAELRRLAVETTVITPALPGAARWMAGALLRLGGVTRLIADASAPTALFGAAAKRLTGNGRPELVVVYANDADLAGHAWGWMSPAYLRAAQAVDRGLAHILPFIDDPETLVITTADHGGGGVLPDDHDHPHPVNERIPLVLAGGRVTAGTGREEQAIHLLDIPPTVLHGFGGTAPRSWEGRVIHEAFSMELSTV